MKRSEGTAEPVRVLLIEDNEGFSYFVRDTLTRRQAGTFELESADDLKTGVAILEKADIDVVLLDLGLPDSSGYRTFESTHAGNPEVPVIIISCLDDKDLAIRAVREGAQDYLMKDKVDAELLVRSIRYAIERADADRAMRRLSAKLLRSQDEERRRIARALHDSAGQTLAALTMNLCSIKRQATRLDRESQALLDESIVCARQAGSELRTTSYLLHPPLLDELGLADSVREYADGFARRSGIRMDLEISDSLPVMPLEHATVLFRSMQEALTNVHRHSGSNAASVKLFETGKDIRIQITDYGCGIPTRATRDEGTDEICLGVGIAGMRERLHVMGGRLEIESGDSGTSVTAELPLTGNR